MKETEEAKGRSKDAGQVKETASKSKDNSDATSQEHHQQGTVKELENAFAAAHQEERHGKKERAEGSHKQESRSSHLKEKAKSEIERLRARVRKLQGTGDLAEQEKRIPLTDRVKQLLREEGLLPRENKGGMMDANALAKRQRQGERGRGKDGDRERGGEDKTRDASQVEAKQLNGGKIQGESRKVVTQITTQDHDQKMSKKETAASHQQEMKVEQGSRKLETSVKIQSEERKEEEASASRLKRQNLEAKVGVESDKLETKVETHDRGKTHRKVTAHHSGKNEASGHGEASNSEPSSQGYASNDGSSTASTTTTTTSTTSTSSTTSTTTTTTAEAVTTTTAPASPSLLVSENVPESGNAVPISFAISLSVDSSDSRTAADVVASEAFKASVSRALRKTYGAEAEIVSAKAVPGDREAALDVNSKLAVGVGEGASSAGKSRHFSVSATVLIPKDHEQGGKSSTSTIERDRTNHQRHYIRSTTGGGRFQHFLLSGSSSRKSGQRQHEKTIGMYLPEASEEDTDEDVIEDHEINFQADLQSELSEALPADLMARVETVGDMEIGAVKTVPPLHAGDGDISLRMSPGYYCAIEDLEYLSRRGPCRQHNGGSASSSGNGSGKAQEFTSKYQCEDDCLNEGGCDAFSLDLNAYNADGTAVSLSDMCCTLYTNCTLVHVDGRRNGGGRGDGAGQTSLVFGQTSNKGSNYWSNSTTFPEDQAFFSMLGYRVQYDTVSDTVISSGSADAAERVLNAVLLSNVSNGQPTSNSRVIVRHARVPGINTTENETDAVATYFATTENGTDAEPQFWRLPFQADANHLLRRIRIFDVADGTGLDGLDRGHTELRILSGVPDSNKTLEEVVWPLGSQEPTSGIPESGLDILLKPSRQALGIELRSTKTIVAVRGIQLDAVDVERVSAAAQAEFDTVGSLMQIGGVYNLEQHVSDIMHRMRNFYEDMLGR
ncbi:unnamed protein product [Amoebophrya sp. A25]|nr:unnamed protein product [Amoebophrya sp. A25]|eukprot:GSA25T00006564001.1